MVRVRVGARRACARSSRTRWSHASAVTSARPNAAATAAACPRGGARTSAAPAIAGHRHCGRPPHNLPLPKLLAPRHGWGPHVQTAPCRPQAGGCRGHVLGRVATHDG